MWSLYLKCEEGQDCMEKIIIPLNEDTVLGRRNFFSPALADGKVSRKHVTMKGLVRGVPLLEVTGKGIVRGKEIGGKMELVKAFVFGSGWEKKLRSLEEV